MGKIPGLKQLSLYVDPDLVKRLKIKAVEEGQPLYKIVDLALRDYVKKNR